MFLVSFILVSQKRMHLWCTRMDTQRWQRSRSQVRLSDSDDDASVYGPVGKLLPVDAGAIGDT